MGKTGTGKSSKYYNHTTGAILFEGTIRSNLDVFDNYTDYQLWNALEAVELKNTITAAPGKLASVVNNVCN